MRVVLRQSGSVIHVLVGVFYEVAGMGDGVLGHLTLFDLLRGI